MESDDPAAEITPVPVAEEPNISAVDKCVYKILGAAAAEPTPGTEEQMMADAVNYRYSASRSFVIDGGFCPNFCFLLWNQHPLLSLCACHRPESKFNKFTGRRKWISFCSTLVWTLVCATASFGALAPGPRGFVSWLPIFSSIGEAGMVSKCTPFDEQAPGGLGFVPCALLLAERYPAEVPGEEAIEGFGYPSDIQARKVTLKATQQRLAYTKLRNKYLSWRINDENATCESMQKIMNGHLDLGGVCPFPLKDVTIYSQRFLSETDFATTKYKTLSAADYKFLASLPRVAGKGIEITAEVFFSLSGPDSCVVAWPANCEESLLGDCEGCEPAEMGVVESSISKGVQVIEETPIQAFVDTPNSYTKCPGLKPSDFIATAKPCTSGVVNGMNTPPAEYRTSPYSQTDHPIRWRTDVDAEILEAWASTDHFSSRESWGENGPSNTGTSYQDADAQSCESVSRQSTGIVNCEGEGVVDRFPRSIDYPCRKRKAYSAKFYTHQTGCTGAGTCKGPMVRPYTSYSDGSPIFKIAEPSKEWNATMRAKHPWLKKRDTKYDDGRVLPPKEPIYRTSNTYRNENPFQYWAVVNEQDDRETNQTNFRCVNYLQYDSRTQGELDKIDVQAFTLVMMGILNTVMPILIQSPDVRVLLGLLAVIFLGVVLLMYQMQTAHVAEAMSNFLGSFFSAMFTTFFLFLVNMHGCHCCCPLRLCDFKIPAYGIILKPAVMKGERDRAIELNGDGTLPTIGRYVNWRKLLEESSSGSCDQDQIDDTEAPPVTKLDNPMVDN